MEGSEQQPLLENTTSASPTWVPVSELLAAWSDRWPRCFARERWEPHQPLMLGIHRVIAVEMPELAPANIARAMRCYCERLQYLRACIEGAPRVGLDGEPAGTVTPAEANNSAAMLTDVLRRRDARDAAVREAARAARQSNRPAAMAPPELVDAPAPAEPPQGRSGPQTRSSADP
jgi:ProP effector